MHLAQAALSEQMRKLEAELGTALFHRGRRETVLTAAGEMLRPHAETLLEQASAAKRAVQDLMGLNSGRLIIGAIPSVSACLLPAAIAAFRKRHPLVELALHEGTSEEVARWVESGRVEFGIVQQPTPSGSFHESILFTEPFVLLLPKQHAAAGQRTIRLSKLAKEPFVFYKGRAHDTALTACRNAGFEPRVACESSELETVRSLVAAGLGIAILPQLATRHPSPGCTVVRLRDTPVERQVALLSRSSHTASPGATVFREILTKSWGV